MTVSGWSVWTADLSDSKNSSALALIIIPFLAITHSV